MGDIVGLHWRETGVDRPGMNTKPSIYEEQDRCANRSERIPAQLTAAATVRALSMSLAHWRATATGPGRGG